MTDEKVRSKHFIEEIIEEDLASGKHGSIHTRFPPEPNGYLHIGHAKAIWINFSLAQKYGGKTNLRFDDTNPEKEETEYVESIQRDIKWLGYNWNDVAYFASDYFGTLYDYAVQLIKQGDAYVDESTAEEIAEQKGIPTKAGTESPFRNRPVEESLSLFAGMKNGDFEDGAMVLRAKVDMTSPNMHLRDPIIYRIKRAHHHRTGDDWCIYPMYDFAHGQSDSIENITHSLCSLEFRHHRPLYNWFIEKLGIFPSRQIEFARMNVAFMITSKRRLLKLVNEGLVSGWDDPRMPTLSGMRRRGYPPEAILRFCEKTGVAKRDNLVEVELLESCVRDRLNEVAIRAMVVTNPLKVVITNFDKDLEIISAVNNPEDEAAGRHDVILRKEIYIEKEDFMIDPPKKYFRMAPDKDVRLKSGFILHCDSYTQDDNGEVIEVQCSYYPNSKSGEDVSGVKAKGTLHWVSAQDAVEVSLRNYDRLFTDPAPLSHDDKDFMEFFNHDSLHVNDRALAEPFIKEAKANVSYQFMRKGYYILDESSTEDTLIFNKSVGLRDSWSKKK